MNNPSLTLLDEYLKKAHIPILFSIIAILFLRGIGNNTIGYPDADRILMDGVFIQDFLRTLPKLDYSNVGFQSLYEFTTNYFAQYPALSIGYRPPFFAFIEGLFNLVFGLNTWSSRLAMLLFVWMGALAWFRLIERVYDRNTAFFATLILFCNPFIVRWGWYTMLDVPALSMVLITAYIFYRYTEQQSPGWLYAAAIVFSLTLWTKQTTMFMVLWIVGYLFFKKQFLSTFSKKNTWMALILALILVIPLIIITLWLGDLNLTQSIGNTESRLEQLPRYHWKNIILYPKLVWQVQLTHPVFYLSMLGFLAGILKRDRSLVYFIFSILSTFLFFTALNDPKVPRYTLYWIPAFSLMAVLPFYYLKTLSFIPKTGIKIGSIIGVILLLLLTGHQIALSYAQPQDYSVGYEPAAKIAMDQADSPILFVDAFNNGYFTYFVRINDPEKRFFVLRGDKLLHSSAMEVDTWQTVHIKDKLALKKMFQQFGVSVVVVESRNYAKLAIHQTLRDWLETDDFQLIEKIPVESNRSVLKNQTLNIYRYKKFQPPTSPYIELHLPIVGKVLRVPFKPLK